MIALLNLVNSELYIFGKSAAPVLTPARNWPKCARVVTVRKSVSIYLRLILNNFYKVHVSFIRKIIYPSLYYDFSNSVCSISLKYCFKFKVFLKQMTQYDI